MEENLQAEEDPKSPSGALTKRIRTMLEKIEGSAPRRMAKMPPKQYLRVHGCDW